MSETTAKSFKVEDPFSQIYAKLWDAFENHQGFTDLVKVGNRIRFDKGAVDPQREKILENDLPEVAVFETSGENFSITPNKNSSLMGQAVYEVRVSTGEMSGETLRRVKWEILIALTKAGVDLGDLSFVRNINVSGAFTSSLGNTAANRGIAGWSTVFSVVVDLNIGVDVILEL